MCLTFLLPISPSLPGAGPSWPSPSSTMPLFHRGFSMMPWQRPQGEVLGLQKVLGLGVGLNSGWCTDFFACPSLGFSSCFHLSNVSGNGGEPSVVFCVGYLLTVNIIQLQCISIYRILSWWSYSMDIIHQITSKTHKKRFLPGQLQLPGPNWRLLPLVEELLATSAEG